MKFKPKKRRKNRSKFKLKKNTIYNIFGIASILGGVLLFFSYTLSGDALILLNDLIVSLLGGLSFLAPIFLILLGFYFLKLKLFISSVHYSLGFFILSASLVSITRSGTLGVYLHQIVAEIITVPGANIVFLAGITIGLIVFFDTSVDEILKAVSYSIKTLSKIVPSMPNRSKPDQAPPGLKPRELNIKETPSLKDSAIDKSLSPVGSKSALEEKLVFNTQSGQSGIWEYPPLSLISETTSKKADRGNISEIADTIESTLKNFRVEAQVAEVNPGPAVTQYALEIGQGVKVSKITALANDLALATQAPTGQIRIEAPIPGRNLVGIEIPNKSLEVVTLRTMLASSTLQKAKSKLSVPLGLDVAGNPVIADISKMPHVLVAGTTGSGKSVLINSFIASFLFRTSPSEVRLILVDPKRVEFTAYNGIPHLLTPVIVEPDKILSALKWAVGEMDRRYKEFAKVGVRNIDGFNELSGIQALPYIVVIIDELADLMMFAPVEVEDAIARLAQMARATGIHLVVATQRPSVNVITGLIKANIPTRIAFNVSSMIDSRVILDSPGAEKLLGRGDMLYIPPDQAKPSRIQGSFISEKEVKNVVDFLKKQNIPVEYTEEVVNQPMTLKKSAGGSGSSQNGELAQAINIVCQNNKASTSMLQRKMAIGYAKAARIMDELEELNIISPPDGSNKREVYITNAEEYLRSTQEAA